MSLCQNQHKWHQRRSDAWPVGISSWTCCRHLSLMRYVHSGLNIMAESSSSSDDHRTTSTKRNRGPTKCKNMKKAGEVNVIEFDDKHRPIGPGKGNFKNYVECLAHIHVDINISDWHKVDPSLKDMMWEEIKREFNIPDDAVKKGVLRVAGMRWKDFKTRLVHDYITHDHSKYTSPTQLYDFITEEQWDSFKKERQTEKFKEKSKKARDAQLRNEHPHYMGSVGYAGMKPQWLVSDPLSSSSSCEMISSSIISEDRSLDWIRARSKKKEDGSYYIPNEKTRGVFDKIVEKAE